MKKFIQKSAIAGLLTLAILLGLAFGSLTFFTPQYINDYNASILDKTDRLKTLSSPKIILVGNSNLAFGIDSAMIEDALGMSVVNLGLHGGLGNEFHEKMAEINAGGVIW